MDARSQGTDLLNHMLRTQTLDPRDGSQNIPLDLGVGHLRVRHGHLGRIGQQGGVDLVMGTDHDVHLLHDRPGHHPERPRVVPLVGAKVQVEHHGRSVATRRFGRKHGCRPTRFAGKVGAGKLEYPAVVVRRGQHVVDGDVDVGAILPVEDQREPVRRFNPQDHRTRAQPGLAYDPLCFHAFVDQELQHEIPNRIVPDPGQERSPAP